MIVFIIDPYKVVFLTAVAQAIQNIIQTLNQSIIRRVVQFLFDQSLRGTADNSRVVDYTRIAFQTAV